MALSSKQENARRRAARAAKKAQQGTGNAAQDASIVNATGILDLVRRTVREEIREAAHANPVYAERFDDLNHRLQKVEQLGHAAPGPVMEPLNLQPPAPSGRSGQNSASDKPTVTFDHLLVGNHENMKRAVELHNTLSRILIRIGREPVGQGVAQEAPPAQSIIDNMLGTGIGIAQIMMAIGDNLLILDAAVGGK